MLDIANCVFGRLTAIGAVAKRHKQGSVVWKCACVCGNVVQVPAVYLRTGHTKSCGCLARDTIKYRNWKHGHTSNKHISPEFSMWASAKSRAKRKGLIFNLKVTDIIIPERCPVFADIILRSNVRGNHESSPTLDRLKPELGYTRDNVRVIRGRANFIKHNATVAELRRIADWLENEIK